MIRSRFRPSSAAVRQFADDAGRSCQARLITVVPGSPLEGEPITIDLAEQVGALAGRVQAGLAGFFHPAAGRVLDWDVRRAAEVVPPITADPGLLALAPGSNQRSRPRVRCPACSTPMSRDQRAGRGRPITGLVDFGDMHHTAAVCDLAVTLTSVLRHTADERPADTWSLAAAVLRGYLRHRTMTAAEVEVLGELVLARLP